MVAVLAREHGIPFYVAALLTTLIYLASGEQIPIERGCLNHTFGSINRADGVKVHNPAFDDTPNHLIAAIITDQGVARTPYRQS